MEQPLVYVRYGFCAGLPPLTGVGRITDTKERWGATWVFVEPVKDMPLPKWVLFSEVQYVFAEKTEAA